MFTPEIWANWIFSSVVVGSVAVVFGFWRWVMKCAWRSAVGFTALVFINILILIYGYTKWWWTGPEPSEGPMFLVMFPLVGLNILSVCLMGLFIFKKINNTLADGIARIIDSAAFKIVFSLGVGFYLLISIAWGLILATRGGLEGIFLFSIQILPVFIICKLLWQDKVDGWLNKFCKLATNTYGVAVIASLAIYMLTSFTVMYQKVVYDKMVWDLLGNVENQPASKVIEQYRSPNAISKESYYLAKYEDDANAYLYCHKLNDRECKDGFKVIVWEDKVVKKEGMILNGPEHLVYLSYIRWFENYLLAGKIGWDYPRGY